MKLSVLEAVSEQRRHSSGQKLKWEPFIGQKLSETDNSKTETTGLLDNQSDYYELITLNLFYLDVSLLDDYKFLENLVDE